MRLIRLGNNHNPRRIPIKPVNNPGPKILKTRRKILDMMHQCIDQRTTLIPPGRMNDNTRLLVKRDHLVIFIYNIKRNILANYLTNLARRVDVLEELRDQLGRLVNSREDLDLRRIEHVLVDLKESQSAVGDAVMRAVERVTGTRLTGDAEGGILHLINSGPATLDATGQAWTGLYYGKF